MLLVLILGVMAVVALSVMLLQRNQGRKTNHETYFSHTLGISDPAPVKAEDDASAL
jgi:hypothetical protein